MAVLPSKRSSSRTFIRSDWAYSGTTVDDASHFAHPTLAGRWPPGSVSSKRRVNGSYDTLSDIVLSARTGVGASIDTDLPRKAVRSTDRSTFVSEQANLSSVNLSDEL